MCVGSLSDNLFRSAGPQTIPSQTYDYAALNLFALTPPLSVGNDSSKQQASASNEHHEDITVKEGEGGEGEGGEGEGDEGEGDEGGGE